MSDQFTPGLFDSLDFLREINKPLEMSSKSLKKSEKSDIITSLKELKKSKNCDGSELDISALLKQL